MMWSLLLGVEAVLERQRHQAGAAVDVARSRRGTPAPRPSPVVSVAFRNPPGRETGVRIPPGSNAVGSIRS